MARFSEQQHLVKASRSRARRRAMVKIFLGWFLVLVVCGGGAYFLFTTEALIVREVRVEGVRLVDHERVKETLAAAVTLPPRSWFGRELTPFWLFLAPPESFFTEFPMFSGAEVTTDLFARKVTIRAEERELYGVWCLAGTDCYAFDLDGIAFGKAPTTHGTLVTRVNDARTAALRPGETVLANAEWRVRMLETLAILDTLRLSPRVITVHEEALREWEVALAEGPTLKFSFAFVPERLEDALASLSRRGDFRALTYLDFRIPDRLYYK